MPYSSSFSFFDSQILRFRLESTTANSFSTSVNRYNQVKNEASQHFLLILNVSPAEINAQIELKNIN